MWTTQSAGAKYNIPVQFRYDYTETTPENLYQEEGDKILADLKKRFTYKGLDGCRMRNGYHFDYKGLHMTYHKTLPYSTIVETGDDGGTYDSLYDILIKQNGDIHSDWTGVKLDVDAYRKVVFEPYDLRVRGHDRLFEKGGNAMSYQAAVITVSDRASAGVYEDKTTGWLWPRC